MILKGNSPIPLKFESNMIIAVAQLNFHIGNLYQNTEKIIGALRQGKERGADLVVFAEMALTGYPAKDLWLSEDFIGQTEAALQRIASHCIGIACILGAPIKNSSLHGKPLHNSAVLLENGQVRSVTHKGLVPDYDVFDEFRYFQPGERFDCVEYRGVRIALTICEDLWNVDTFALYPLDPMARLSEQKPDLMINIAASPFAMGHYEARMDVLRTHVLRHRIPLVYANQVGAQTDLIFDGRSLVLDAEGEILDELAAFDEDLRVYRFESGQLQRQGVQPEDTGGTRHSLSVDPNDPIALVHQALILGIRDFFAKSGFRKAVLGLSGGLDSAVVAALACEALGPENVLAVLMPSVYSSDHSIKDAEDLAANTGCESLNIPIHLPALAFSDALTEIFKGLKADTTEENIQARTRAVILMALSNKFGHVLLNTSNKSESAVGYGTLYGDMAGSLSVIGDVYKTDVYRLAAYINREGEIIPAHTIEKPPSAELRPDQKDSDSLPDYPLLDTILRAYIEDNATVDRIKQAVGEPALVDRVIAMVDRAEFKRYQAPPTLRVSKKAFGPGRSMPLVAKKVGPFG